MTNRMNALFSHQRSNQIDTGLKPLQNGVCFYIFIYRVGKLTFGTHTVDHRDTRAGSKGTITTTAVGTGLHDQTILLCADPGFFVKLSGTLGLLHGWSPAKDLDG